MAYYELLFMKKKILLMMDWLLILPLLFTTIVENINCEDQAWNCKFTEKDSAITMDFTSLYNNKKDYYLHNDDKNENESLRIQLCGPLNNKCNGKEGYSACFQTGNKEIGLGRVPVNSHEDGRIMFNYTGDKCKDDNYKLHVMMKCDYGAEDAYPELFPYAQNQCTFFILWRTILACARYKSDPVSVDCTVKDANGNVYDLSDLKRLDDNYIVPISSSASIILNVCHPVVYGYGAVCPDDSGACLRTNSGTISYKNIGSVKSLKWEGSNPVLNYDMAELCQTGGGHTQTTISFVCDFKANNTAPILTSIEKECHYKMSWRTAAACNEKELKEYSRKTAAPCRITNPVTLTEYNLNSLKGEDRIVKTKNGSEYKFSVCGPMLSKFCQAEAGDTKGEAGVCAGFSQAIGGKGNSNLLWNLTGPYLNYTDGSPCDKNKTRATIIAFACGREGSNKTNFIEDGDPCNLRIHYYTPLVCEREDIPCGIGLELGENGSCVNRSSSQPLLSTIAPTTNDIPTNQNTIKKYSGITIVIILCGVCGIFMTVYLLNSQRREYLRSRCCSWHFRSPDVRMQYSRINSVEETDALLDAPDTHCQSDSDDDLLRI